MQAQQKSQTPFFTRQILLWQSRVELEATLPGSSPCTRNS